MTLPDPAYGAVESGLCGDTFWGSVVVLSTASPVPRKERMETKVRCDVRT
jgi:hypothetical protein